MSTDPSDTIDALGGHTGTTKRGWVLIFMSFAVIFLSIGVYISLDAIFQSRECRKWPTTTANVIESRTWRDLEPHQGAMGRRYVILSQQFHMRYSYLVAGVRYQSTKISYDLSSSRLTEIVKANPPYSTMQIFYDPQDPRRAVVDPLVGSGTISVFCICALLLITDMCLIFRHVRYDLQVAK